MVRIAHIKDGKVVNVSLGQPSHDGIEVPDGYGPGDLYDAGTKTFTHTAILPEPVKPDDPLLAAVDAANTIAKLAAVVRELILRSRS